MTKISDSSIAHKMSKDLKAELLADTKVADLWNNLTPIAQNEFICWVENAKQITTRERRIKRTVEELLAGKRRPCCWVGCIHRKDKSLNSTQKWMFFKK